MIRRLAVLAALGGTLLPAVAAAQHAMHDDGGAAPAAVSMAYITYAPAHLEVLVGRPVVWSNDSARNHTVTADDGSFDSGRLAVGERFTHTFMSEGEVTYHCDLHAGMAGMLDVRTLLLDAPAAAAGPGRAYPVAGRTALPPGTDVTLESDTGTGYAAIAHASVADDGTFATTVLPRTSGTLRAVAGGAISPPVNLVVLDRHVAVSARSHRNSVSVTATATPAAPGATAVLQLDLPEHFGWWPVRQLRLDRNSRATFVQSLHRRVRARVVLTLADGATPLAISPVVRVGTARRPRAPRSGPSLAGES